jgi:hypothetical protein
MGETVGGLSGFVETRGTWMRKIMKKKENSSHQV